MITLPMAGYHGAELSAETFLGTLVLTWSDQGTVDEGDPIEFESFKDAISDRMNP